MAFYFKIKMFGGNILNFEKRINKTKKINHNTI